MTIGGETLHLEVAQSPEEQRRGLAGRWCRLRDNQGMVFMFDEPATPTFWMKGMRYPLDIIWIADGRVIGWEALVPADQGRTTYPAPAPIDQVLEVSAGWVERHALKVGDQASIEPPSET